MVFAALTQYGVILIIKFKRGIPLEQINHRTNKIGDHKNITKSRIINVKESNKLGIINNEHQPNDINTTLVILHNIDFLSLIIFPATFFVFITIYCVLFVI